MSEETMVQNADLVSPTNGAGVTGIPEKANLSFSDADFASDIAKLAAESGMTIAKPEPSAPMTPPTTPEQPAPQAPVTKTDEATKAVEVPDKFKAPDGSIDTAKLTKSMDNAEEMLAKYLNMEKELKRKMNEVKVKENPYLNPPTPQIPTPQIPINTDFAKQLEADMAKDGAGVVLAKLFTAAQQAATEQAKAEIEAIKGKTAEMTTKAQIEAIAKNDPWVYTEEGVNTLNKILNDQTYLWGAEDPYKAAYLIYKGRENVASRGVSQVLTPTPPARPSAPIPTGQAANRTPAPVVRLDSKEAIDNHLKTLSAKEQDEFFKKAGFPSFSR